MARAVYVWRGKGVLAVWRGRWDDPMSVHGATVECGGIGHENDGTRGASVTITFLASLPYPHTAMRVLGDGGYVVYLNVPEDEMGAVMQLMLMRQSVIRFTAEDMGAQPIKAKRGKKRQPDPEWGDDDESDDTG